MFAKSVKYFAEVRLVLILSVAKHQNIIQIHQHKIISVPMHNGIHESLKGTWGITKLKWQNCVLEQAISCYKGSLFTCIWCKSNLVVSTGQVYCTQTHCL